MNDVKNRAESIRLVPLSEIKLNPKNRNKHSDEQISRLAEIIKYQGFREPGTISNRSGFLAAGEGRYLAAKKLGMAAMPCVLQDFDSEEQEYAYGVSTNAIAAWSELDLSAIHLDLPNLAPFDIEMLGIRDFKMEPDFASGTIDEQGRLDEKKPVECPKCGHSFVAS